MINYLGKLIAWLFPFYCLGCGAQDKAICQECLEKIKIFSGNEFCVYCQRKRVWMGLTCDGCSNADVLLDGLWAIFEYEKRGLLSQALHGWKYQQIQEFWQDLQVLIEKNWPKELMIYLENNFEVICPIPMTLEKLRRREFNQSKILADKLPIKLERVDLLEKNRETAAQMSLGREDRLKNLGDAFKFYDGKVYEKVILIDDISTTRATLEEAARCLKRAGVKRIYGLVLARQSFHNQL